LDREPGDERDRRPNYPVAPLSFLHVVSLGSLLKRRRSSSPHFGDGGELPHIWGQWTKFRSNLLCRARGSFTRASSLPDQLDRRRGTGLSVVVDLALALKRSHQHCRVSTFSDFAFQRSLLAYRLVVWEFPIVSRAGLRTAALAWAIAESHASFHERIDMSPRLRPSKPQASLFI